MWYVWMYSRSLINQIYKDKSYFIDESYTSALITYLSINNIQDTQYLYVCE